MKVLEKSHYKGGENNEGLKGAGMSPGHNRGKQSHMGVEYLTIKVIRKKGGELESARKDEVGKTKKGPYRLLKTRRGLEFKADRPQPR